MEMLGLLFGATIAWQALAWSIGAVVFPLFWLWMLIDAILREPSEYPTRTSNEKLVWVLLLVFFQLPALVYLFMVFRKAKRGAVVAPAAYAAA
ncbi:MAG TPA: PLDc N-terminal domain-containing protein [Coriobacteriia bacterium]